MSQLILASSALRNAKHKAASYTNAFQMASYNHLPQPILPFKIINPLKNNAYKFHTSSSSYKQEMTQQRKIELITNNISKLYARRVLELAALSAATKVAITNMEAGIIPPPPPKPTEWETVDLAAQRKEFGENISSLGKTSFSRVWAAGSRLASLAMLAYPLTILAPIGYISGPNTKLNNYAWDYAIWSIEKAGPTFIKLIQWASTRNDLFPAEFINKFATLQDNTRGHTWADTKKLLESELGTNYEDIFEFDTSTKTIHDRKAWSNRNRSSEKYTPIGSGCVAQVYKAKLKRSTAMLPIGSDVAIKVTHPNILHKVCVDFYILNKITSFLEKIPNLDLDYLSMKDSVEQFRDIMLPQLDLRVEARNLTRFRRDFASDSQVSFPAPVKELTSANILVESFIHGEPIMQFARMENSTEEERKVLATIGLETVMNMIFLHDFVHGDLHPGNILVNRNKDVKGHPLRLNMIDCGLVVEMGQTDHESLTKILGAFVKRDGKGAGMLMIDTARKCQATELDMELFCRGIQKIVEDDEEQNFLESVGDYIADICFLACKHKVKLQASCINAALACEIMEGIASTLYPEMKVQRIALPVVFKAEVMHGLAGMKKNIL